LLENVSALKIAVPILNNKGFKSTIEEYFNRVAYFTLIEVVDGDAARVTMLGKPLRDHGPGNLPRLLKSHGVNVVLAGRVRQGTQVFFRELGTELVLDLGWSAAKAVRRYPQGKVGRA